MTEKINITTENICTERKKFQVPNQTFRVLTLNGVTTVAAYENETLHTSLSRCNRLRDVDLAAVSLIEPSSGAYVELNELSSKFNSSILILQTDDSSYKKSTNQHSFSRKIQVQKMKCSQCNASQWFRRPKYCRECMITICSRCCKSGNIPQCSTITSHHQHFATNVSRFKSRMG